MFQGLPHMSERLRSTAMDPLGDLLDGVRVRTAAFCQAVLDPPWGLRIDDRAPLALATPLRGHAWVILDDGEKVLVEAGGVAIVQGPESYTVADKPTTPPQISVRPGNRLIDLDGSTAPAPPTSAEPANPARPCPPDPLRQALPCRTRLAGPASPPRPARNSPAAGRVQPILLGCLKGCGRGDAPARGDGLGHRWDQ
jgi:hypothetical protein